MTRPAPLRPLHVGAAVLATMMGCAVADEIPDEPLPGRDALVARFGVPEPGTVVVRERDLGDRDVIACAFDRIRADGFAPGEAFRTLQLDAPSFEGPRPDGIAAGGVDLYGTAEADSIAVGDTLLLSAFADGCGEDGGQDRDGVTVYVTASDADGVAAVFEGDITPVQGLFGPLGRAFRLLGAFHVDLTAEASDGD